MNIANELHASELLNRTAPDLGVERNIFLHAVSIEFCSAVISHKLVASDPSNMVLCPFTISIYVLPEDPDIVYVAYKPPTAGEGSSEVLTQTFHKYTRALASPLFPQELFLSWPDPLVRHFFGKSPEETKSCAIIAVIYELSGLKEIKLLLRDIVAESFE